MVDLNDYFYFVHVVEKKGFSQAARALDMPKSRLSRHVSKLEARLDTKLIQRTSRQFSVTDAGQLFFRHAKAVMEEAAAAEAAIQTTKQTLSGRVTMSCSVGMAQFALKDLVVKFLAEQPKVELVQQVTNEAIDLIASGVDLAIRGHIDTLPDSTSVQRHLATVSWHLFASPEYLERTGTPVSPYDLYKRQSLKVGWQPASGHWNLTREDGLKTTIPFSPQLCSDDMSTLKSAAVEGLGIVSLPAYTSRKELAQGSLVRVLPEWHTGIAQLTLLRPSRKGQSPSVNVFSDYLLANMGREVGD